MTGLREPNVPRDRMRRLKGVVAVANLYQSSNESKTIEIEDTIREGFPFRMVITLRKLGVVTILNQGQGGMCIRLRRGIGLGIWQECFGP